MEHTEEGKRSEMLNPRYGNIHLDANALEPPSPADKLLVAKFRKLVQDYDLSVINPAGVQQEIDDPRTPINTKTAMGGIFTIPTNLTASEQIDLFRLRQVVCGDAAASKHMADASHIFEAVKNGGRYFITHDKRLLRRKKEIATILNFKLEIVTLSEFMAICGNFDLI